MPFKSESFHGSVRLGDFTLTQPQITALMEPMRTIPLSRVSIETVMSDPIAWYKGTLKQYGLGEFQMVKVSGGKEPEYLLWATRKNQLLDESRYTINRRASMMRRRLAMMIQRKTMMVAKMMIMISSIQR